MVEFYPQSQQVVVVEFDLYRLSVAKYLMCLCKILTMDKKKLTMCSCKYYE